MTEDQASEQYWKAVHALQEVIDSGHRGDKSEVLSEVEDDLTG